MNPRNRLTLALALAGASVAGLGLAQNVPAPSAPPVAATSPTVVTVPTPGAAPTQVLAPPDEAPIPAAPPVKQAEAAPTPVIPAAPKAPPVPLKRPRYSAAVLQGVDKITAETLRFETKIGEAIRYKGLIVTVHACEGAAADEGGVDAIAHLDVQSRPEGVNAARTIYRGWMYASSPSLHPMEHPVYDLWLIACKTASPEA